ncbi:T-complex protein 1 subunit zeta [Dictyocoela muelleri]|nr:T-complex protein 1 subunit zeta [Dictyocoela muelleri]
MSLLGKNTEITQFGQAIKINVSAASSLSQLFSSSIGPYGTFKMLITPSQQITITKTGSTMIDDIKFTHPSSLIINKAARQHCEVFGDGTSTFVVLCCELFKKAYEMTDEMSVHKVVRELNLAMRDVMNIIQGLREEVEIYQLVYSALNTKMQKSDAKKLAKILCDAVQSIAKNEVYDLNMIEIIKMEDDVADIKFIKGLVLDHAGRHPMMPTNLTDVMIMITNISLEYEKPEINAEFQYSSAAQRDILAENERNFIIERAKKIVGFAKEIQNTGKSFMLITECGIDPFSLEILSNAGILGLRRAKRRNLERLVRACGGNIITSLKDLDKNNLGYAREVKVVSRVDEKYTFILGTPFSNSCTILLSGNNRHEMTRMQTTIKNILKTINPTQKRHLQGGIRLYNNIINNLSNSTGHQIYKSALQVLNKTLKRNSSPDIEDEIYDNFDVVSSIIQNTCVVAINMLMIDEIIKAGKSVKEEKTSSQPQISQ